MTNHKEILRLKSLGLSNKEIAAACGCGRNTVTHKLQRAQEASVSWEQLRALPPEKVTGKLFSESTEHPTHRMPDYEQIHKEMQKSGVTLSLLWVEYCEQCLAAGEILCQSTQFNNFAISSLTPGRSSRAAEIIFKPSLWKVKVSMFTPSFLLMRSCISSADFFVKTIRRISSGFTPFLSHRYFTLPEIVSILPLPAPAKTRSLSSPVTMAVLC